MCSPEALLNTLWLNNTLHFGLCGCQEHRDMCWGDVKLQKTASGVEYLEFNERQTKARTGSACSDVRTVPPKMFATDGTERDPVAVYKCFASFASIENYSTVSTKQQMHMSKVLSSVMAGTTASSSSETGYAVLRLSEWW